MKVLLVTKGLGNKGIQKNMKCEGGGNGEIEWGSIQSLARTLVTASSKIIITLWMPHWLCYMTASSKIIITLWMPGRNLESNLISCLSFFSYL